MAEKVRVIARGFTRQFEVEMNQERITSARIEKETHQATHAQHWLFRVSEA